jgi:hypothetical protein
MGLLEVRRRSGASGPVYAQMASPIADGVRTRGSRGAAATGRLGHAGRPRRNAHDVYDDRTSTGSWRRELTVPRSFDRPGQPPVPDQPDATETPDRLRDLPAAPDRGDHRALADAGRWSKADLRQRLEHLPPGHPSSLRSDGPESSQARELRKPQDAGNADREADAIKQNYWSEVPRFLRAWADHVRRWPAERVAAVVDRTRDPAGSWRGDGNQYLDPEQHAQTKDVIAGVDRSEKKLTEHIGHAERKNTHGGRLEGIEHRLKGEERLKEKVAEKIQHEPNKLPAEVVRQITDAIRYTFCFESVDYTAGYWDVKERLEAHEYRMVYSKNHWRDDPEYKGINTRWVTPEGQRFEMQFHTAESYDAKQEVTHGSYERLRSPLTQDEERHELRLYQREVCRWIAAPEGATAIVDYLPKG